MQDIASHLTTLETDCSAEWVADTHTGRSPRKTHSTRILGLVREHQADKAMDDIRNTVVHALVGMC